MTLQQPTPTTFKINRFPDLLYTKSSTSELNRLQAIKFAQEQGAVLQSMPEAAAFRMEGKGQDYADEYQITRTAAIYMVEAGKVMVGFDHDPKKSLVLTTQKEPIQALKSGGEYVYLKNDERVNEMMGRITFSTYRSQLELKLNGTFSNDPIVKELLGDVAAAYESYLKGKDFTTAVVYLFKQDEVKKSIRGNNILVRPCALCAGCTIISEYAGGFNGSNYARGVIHPAPAGRLNAIIRG